MIENPYETFSKNCNRFFLTTGAADSCTSLSAIDQALKTAHLSDIKLIPLSSPPCLECQRSDPFSLEPDSAVPVIYSSITSKYPGEHISSAVAIAVPENRDYPAYIFKKSDFLEADSVENEVRTIARKTLETKDLKIKELSSISIEHDVEYIGTTFAAVVFG